MSGGNREPSSIVAALGSFDGLHLGHQKILDELSRSGGTQEKALISFYPHPSVVLGKTNYLPKISSLRKRVEILKDKGIDRLFLIHFTRALSRLTYQCFVKDLLINSLGVSKLIIGPDARIGRKAEGTSYKIADLMADHGASAVILDEVKIDQLKVGSRHIRESILRGNVEEAAQYLGRPYSIDARVVRGDRRDFSIPTATLNSYRQCIPANGVYACRAHLKGVTYLAVCNIGTQPTFGENRAKIELHLLDYSSGDFYGERIENEFLARIRDEKRFDSVEQLLAQIKGDICQARKLLITV